MVTGVNTVSRGIRDVEQNAGHQVKLSQELPVRMVVNHDS